MTTMKDITKEELEQAEWELAIYSLAYYNNDDSIISDAVYDDIASSFAETLDIIRREKGEDGAKEFLIEETHLGYLFYDFDGNTTFDLADRVEKHSFTDLLLLSSLYEHIAIPCPENLKSAIERIIKERKNHIDTN